MKSSVGRDALSARDGVAGRRNGRGGNAIARGGGRSRFAGEGDLGGKINKRGGTGTVRIADIGRRRRFGLLSGGSEGQLRNENRRRWNWSRAHRSGAIHSRADWRGDARAVGAGEIGVVSAGAESEGADVSGAEFNGIGIAGARIMGDGSRGRESSGASEWALVRELPAVRSAGAMATARPTDGGRR